MCGIHLIWGQGANEESIRKLVAQSRHRGPDQEAVYSPWPGLWIGVNRLKILHPGPDADQPFWSQDGQSLLIWNGEIYNYQALRSLLTKMGGNFNTQSDTEVLLHWIKIFGTQGLEKLQGMFALIYVNLSDKSVLVARDRSGEKPLYYSQNQHSFLLSSETLGMTELLKPKTDWDQLEHYFILRTPLQGKTFFKKIKEWKPARYSTIYQHSSFRWDNIPSAKSKEENIGQKEFKGLLTEAISKQFHADVPVGMMLSGGADSSLLYALWHQETGRTLPAYTIQVEKKYRSKYGDGNAASRFVKKFPADHRLVNIDQKVFWENWEPYLNSVDQPIGDSAGFLSWMIAKEAKADVKVLISGAGADELWGGYQRHEAYFRYLEKKDFLVKWSSLLEKLPFGREWKKFMSGIDSHPNKTFLNFSGLQNPGEELAEDYERVFNPHLPDYKRGLSFDRQVYLVQDVLKIHDNALMAHGVEGRAPYLDVPMLNYWEKIDDPALLRGKVWIKGCLEELDLGWISARKKFGFGLPLAEWLGEKGEFSKRVFSSIQAFEQTHGSHFPESMRPLAKNPQAGVKTHFLTIYNLFLLAEWAKLREL